MRILPNWRRGVVPPSGRKLQLGSDAIRQLQNWPAMRGPDQERQIIFEGLGTVTDKGPGGEQYATKQTTPDERHWVQISYIKAGNVWDAISLQPNKLLSPSIVYCSNLPDIASHSHSLTKGQAVRVWAELDRATPTNGNPNPSKAHWFTESARTNGIFRVNLSQTGGSAGSSSAAPSWVYTVTDDAGNTLGTNLSPARGRDYNGKRNDASLGYGHYGPSGFVLDEAWESPTTFACSS